MKSAVAKKIILAVLIFVVLLICLDVIVFYTDSANTNKRIAKINKGLQKVNETYYLQPLQNKYSLVMDDYSIEQIVSENFRPPIIKNDNSDNIFIFGCSYAYGGPLEDNENFSAYLAQNTPFSVYNFGYGGWGIQHFLALLEYYDFSEIKPPKYVIYVYMGDHIRRMFSKYYEFWYSCYFRYILKNDKFYIDRLNLPTLYMYRKFHIAYNKAKSYDERLKEKNFALFIKYIEKINSLVRQKFPDSKFIIFVYDDCQRYDWTPVKDMGITVIAKDDLCSDTKYDTRLSDGHPTAEAWKFYTPLFVKAADIKN